MSYYTKRFALATVDIGLCQLTSARAGLIDASRGAP